MAQTKVRFDRAVEGATNIVDSGTEGTKVAAGTTGERGSTTGQWRYNTTTGYFEGRNNAGSFSTLEPTPTVSSVDVTEVDSTAGGTQTFVITGTNFSSGGTITFVGSDGTEVNANSTTYNSTTQVTAVEEKATFVNAKEPWKIKFASSSGIAGTSATGLIYQDQSPNWSTSAGNVGNVLENAAITPIQLTATDPDGDTVTYAETTSNLSGAGFALSSSGSLTGTAQVVSGDVTTSFDVRATANSKTTDRTFNIVTKNLNVDALLFDATNINNPSPAITFSNSNSSGVGLVDSSGNALNPLPSTSVTFTNIHGSSGTLANGASLANYTYTGSYYNTGTNQTGIGHTFWSLATGDPSNVNANNGWFGLHYGGSYSSYTDIWFTYDVGANPSFKLKRITGDTTWRSGNSTYTVYGSTVLPNNGSNMNTKGGFSSANLYSLWSANNPAASFDSGAFSNQAYYRYYVFRMQASGSFDWGWDMTKFYGDYY